MTEPNAPPQERDRFRSAALVFLAIGIVKLFYGFAMGLRLALSPMMSTEGAVGWRLFLLEHQREMGLALFFFYLASAALCYFIARGLMARQPWAVTVGTGYALFQMVGIFFLFQIGLFAVINFVLGLMALVNIHLSKAFADLSDESPGG